MTDSIKIFSGFTFIKTFDAEKRQQKQKKKEKFNIILIGATELRKARQLMLFSGKIVAAGVGKLITKVTGKIDA